MACSINEKHKIITFDGLLFLASDESEIMKNKKKYIDFIESNELAKKYHKHLYKHFNKTISKYIQSHQDDVQSGGSIAMAIGVIGGISLSVVIGYFIYRWVYREVCKPEYPITGDKRVITPVQLLLKIVPKKWLKGTNDPELATKHVLQQTTQMLQQFSMFDEGDSWKSYLGTNLLRVTTSVALDFVTAGAGGDILISLMFTFKSILDLIAEIVKKIVDIVVDDNAMRFIFDIFKINFIDGPFGVRCWVEYMLNEYGDSAVTYNIICDFFNSLMDKIVKFLANAMGAMIPDSAGIPAILVPIIMKYFKQGALALAEEQLNEYFYKIPYDLREMLKNPRLMKGYLDNKIKFGQKMLFGYGKDFFTLLTNNTWTFAYSLHKFFALIFALLRILRTCTRDEQQAIEDKKEDDD